MEKGVNKVILIGNLGADPETRYIPNGGGAITNISVATTEFWKVKQGELQERTEWHKVVFFNKLAEIASEYLKKGSKVYIDGSMRTSKWRDEKNGITRSTTEIIARNLQILDRRGSSSNEQPLSIGDHDVFSNLAQPKTEIKTQAVNVSIADDDIPF